MRFFKINCEKSIRKLFFNNLRLDLRENFDYNFYNSLNKCPDRAKSLTYKLLFLTSCFRSHYVTTQEIYDIRYNTEIINNYFKEIVEKNRDFIFDDSYLLYLVNIAAVEKERDDKDVFSTYFKELENYINSSDNRLYFLYGDYLYFLSCVIHRSSDISYQNDFNNMFRIKRDDPLSDYVLKNTIHSDKRELYSDFYWSYRDLRERTNDEIRCGTYRPYDFTNVENLLLVIGGYCLFYNYLDKFSDYSKTLSDNFYSIIEKCRIQGFTEALNLYNANDEFNMCYANNEFVDSFVSFVIDEIINKKTMIIK